MAGITVVALLLAVMLVSACGSSRPGSGAPTARSTSVSADPPRAPQVAGGASPDSRKSPSATAPSTTATSRAPARHRPIPPAHPVPAAFQPAAGAPSDAEVRAQLAQLDAIQRKEHERAL